MMASCGAAKRQENNALKCILPTANEENSDSDFEDFKVSKKCGSKDRKCSTPVPTGNNVEKMDESKLESTVIPSTEKMDKVSNNKSSSTKYKHNDIEMWTVHCTSCGTQVNHHDKSKVKRHPHLKVLVCGRCYHFYGDGNFTKDENGSDEYCRWCAQGGNLIMCDLCHNSFCKNCIRRNYGRKTLAKAMEDKQWACFVCDPKRLEEKIAYCDAVLAYSKSANSKKSMDQNVLSETAGAENLVGQIWKKTLNQVDSFRKSLIRFKAKGYIKNPNGDLVTKMLCDEINKHVTTLNSCVAELEKNVDKSSFNCSNLSMNQEKQQTPLAKNAASPKIVVIPAPSTSKSTPQGLSLNQSQVLSYKPSNLRTMLISLAGKKSVVARQNLGPSNLVTDSDSSLDSVSIKPAVGKRKVEPMQLDVTDEVTVLSSPEHHVGSQNLPSSLEFAVRHGELTITPVKSTALSQPKLQDFGSQNEDSELFSQSLLTEVVEPVIMIRGGSSTDLHKQTPVIKKEASETTDCDANIPEQTNGKDAGTKEDVPVSEDVFPTDTVKVKVEVEDQDLAANEAKGVEVKTEPVDCAMNGDEDCDMDEIEASASKDRTNNSSLLVSDNEKAKRLLIKSCVSSDSEKCDSGGSLSSSPSSVSSREQRKKKFRKKRNTLKSSFSLLGSSDFSSSSDEDYKPSTSRSSKSISPLKNDKKLGMQVKVMVEHLNLNTEDQPKLSGKEDEEENEEELSSLDYFDDEIKKLSKMKNPKKGRNAKDEDVIEDSSSDESPVNSLPVISDDSSSEAENETRSKKKDDGAAKENEKEAVIESSDECSPSKVKKSNDEVSKMEISSDSAAEADSASDSKEIVDAVMSKEQPKEKTVNEFAKECLLMDTVNSSEDEQPEANGASESPESPKPKKKKKTEDDGDANENKSKEDGNKSDADDNKDGSEDNNSDSDVAVSKKKKPKVKDKLLTTPLGPPEGTKKDEGEAADAKKEKDKKPSKKKRKIVISDDEEDGKEKPISISSSSSDSDDSASSSTKQKSKKKNDDKKGKKRKRIKVADSSENSGSDGEKGSQDTPSKGRKNIRKLISDNRLKDETKAAARAEEERRKRVAEKQKLYNDVVQVETMEAGRVKKLVLEIDPKTKEELVTVHPDLASKLKPHQVNGVRFLWDATIESLEQLKKKTSTGCILAHSMGLGKTLQVITYLHTILTNKFTKEYVKTALIICPYNTVLNWANEFTEWLNTDELSLEVYEMSTIKDNHSRSRYLKDWQEDGGVMIMGYNMFRMLADEKRKRISKKLRESFFASLIDPGPDVVVCDEGHLLKNETSAVSKAVSKIKSLRRIILTGTPLQNNLKEYHCMVHFVKPHLLGTRKEFQNRFMNPIMNGQCADSTPTDFKLMKKRVHILHKLLEGCVQRCDYNVLTPYLPPKHEYIISIRMSENQVKLYLYYLDHFSRGRSEAGTVGASLFKDYNVLKDIWTHPYLLYLTMTRKSLEDYDSMDDFIDDSESDTDDDVVCLTDEPVKKGKRKRRGRKKDDAEEEDEEEEENNSGEGEEVVKKWKTRRGRGEIGESSRADDEDVKETTTWWNEFVSEKDETNIEMSGKMVVLFDILRECELIGDKLLLFSQSLPSLNLVEKMLAYITEQTRNSEGYDPQEYLGIWVPGVDYFRMDGSTNADIRRRCIEAFNDENDRARLFMISTKAGSLGTNLVGANRVVMLDASWNPTHDVQAIFRVFRFGQKKPVYVYRLLAQGTMEEKIYDRQVNKQSLSCRVIDEQQIERHFNASDLQELYTFDPDSHTKRPTPMVPKDRLLAEMLIRHKEWIVHYHEHDSLLQNMPEEDLTEEERKAAWAEYEAEKEGLIQKTTMYEMQGDYMASMSAGTRINLDLVRIIENIKKQKPDVTPSELNSYLYNALGMLRSEYQQYQMNILKQKHQLATEGKPAPTPLLQQQYHTGQIIYELGRIMQELRTGVPASAGLAHQVHQQQYNRRGRPPTSLGVPINIPYLIANATRTATPTPGFRMPQPATSTATMNAFQQAAFLQNLANMRQRQQEQQNMASASTSTPSSSSSSSTSSNSNWWQSWPYAQNAAAAAAGRYYANAYVSNHEKEPVITEVSDDTPSETNATGERGGAGSNRNNSSSVIIQEVE